MSAKTTIVWLRNDLRIADNPALHAAAQRGAVLPVYVLDEEDNRPGVPGAASRVWLHHSLKALSGELEARGTTLLLRRGEPEEVLAELLQESGANRCCWNERYEPQGRQQDDRVRRRIEAAGGQVEVFRPPFLVHFEELRNKQGGPYKVFTPFWNRALEQLPDLEPLEEPQLRAPEKLPAGLPLDKLELLPREKWHLDLIAHWRIGETAAMESLTSFLESGVNTYDELRDLPAQHGTSRLSPHLHFGEISARQVAWRLQRRFRGEPPHAWPEDARRFLAEIGWREFACYLLYHFPHTVDRPMQPTFEHFPWWQDEDALRAWQRGRTGYPIVDAGMRQLWQTGWMHNRVRMIVASFLTKDLLIHWREGAAWFEETLVDADQASNTLGWQWTAGSGADAAPYFRIFNPVTQGRKYDPEGEYVKRWLPELARLPKRWIQNPWEAPEEVLRQAGIILGDTYPHPIVDHGEARERALEAYSLMKRRAAE